MAASKSAKAMESAHVDDPTISSAALSEKTQEAIDIIPDNIAPALRPLISELHHIQHHPESVQFERLESLLISLMKSCKAEDLTLQVSDYLITNHDMLHNLSFLARNTLKGESISYKAASFLTLLYEWLRWLTDEHSLLPVKVAVAGFVETVLHSLEILVRGAHYNKMFNLLVTSLLGFIQNLAVDSACWPYFKPTRFVDILGIHTKALDNGIHFMSLYVLSLLAEVIPLNKQNVLVFEEKLIKEYVDILTTAVSTPSLQATKVYGSLVIPADDILRIMKQIWYIESNRNNIACFLSSLIFPIEMCLQLGNEVQQKAAMDLLWTLISDPNLLLQVRTGHVNIDLQLLERLQLAGSDASNCVRVMTSCVLCKIHPESLKNELAVLEVIKGTYRFKRYAECIDLCNQVLPAKAEADSPEKVTAMLYRGKSFYHLYQQEQKHFQEASSTLSKKEFYLRQNDIYEKAGGAINNLGSLLDLNCPSFLDDEMSTCLDFSMIDVALQVNNLKEYSRCFLCLKKAKLHKSHLCPDSILDAFASGLGKTKNKRIFNLSFFREGKMTSPHGVTMWLFCEKCENILSRDGETHFIPKFFRHIYNIDSHQQPENEIVVSYDQWLYRFSIGLLFRGLINEAISSFLNSNKIHLMFAQLRRLICFEGALSDLSHNPDIYIFISPSVPTVSAGFIGHVYHAPFLFALTDKDLKTGSRITPRACQFFLARIGILNFLLLFDDTLKGFLPSEAKINVSHGEFVVPPEAKRISIIPKGIDQILEDLAVETQKNFLESSVATLWNLKLSDATPPPIQQTATYMTHDAMNSDVMKLEETLLTGQSLNSLQQLNFLPPGFKLEHSNGLVTLPNGHQIIFHGNFEIEMEGSEPFHITLFLAAGNESSSGIFTLKKPYVIFHRYQPGLEITLGYFINPDTLSTVRFLPDPNPKFMSHKIGNQLRIKAFTETLLPQLMKLRGLRSYFTVVHRAMLLRHTITYDHVCGERCWYCELRCNTCLSQASMDLSRKTSEGRSQRFCSKTCENVYSSRVTKEDTVLDVFDSPSKHLLLLSFDTTLPCKTGNYSRAEISVYVSKDAESDGFPLKSLFVVYHHSTAIDQHFLEYFIHDDCSFSHMLHYYGSKEYSEMRYAIDFAEQLITEKLQGLGTNLKTLVDFTFCAQ